jgi:hypothetical protein
LTAEQPRLEEYPLAVEMDTVADRLLSTLQCPTASTTKYTSHRVAESTYTEAVLRTTRAAAARLSDTEYVGLPAKSLPPEAELPDT